MADVTISIGVATQQARAGLSSLRASFTEMNSAVELAGRYLNSVKRITDELIGTASSYAREVRDLARISGASAEETSRLIQISDDMVISYESLTTAARAAAKNGIEFTTESLARMSAEYLALNPGVERSRYLLDRFGRSGLEMGKLLEQGEDSIRSMSDAVSENLVLTEQQVQAARDLEIAQDNLSDTVEGLKVRLGNQLIPVLTDAGTATMTLLTWEEQLDAQYRSHAGEIERTIPVWEDYARELVRSALASGQLHGMEARKAQALLDGEIAAEHQADALSDLVNELDGTTEAQWATTQQTLAWNEAMGGSTAGLHLTKEQAEKFAPTLNDTLTPAIVDAKTAMQELTTELLFNQAAAGLDAAAALQLAGAMGLVNTQTLNALTRVEELKVQYDANADGAIDATEAASGYTREVTALASAQTGLQQSDPYEDLASGTDQAWAAAEAYRQKVDETITLLDEIDGRTLSVSLNLDTSDLTGLDLSLIDGGQPIARAAGGPVWPGQTFLVGENGPEMLNISAGGMGNVTPIVNNTYNMSFGSGSPSGVMAALDSVRVLYG